MPKETKLIKVDKRVYDGLLGKKRHPRQAFSEVIEDLLGKSGRKKKRKRRKVPGVQ